MNKLFNPDYLQSLCKKFGLKPSKKYGQNFLISEEPIIKMLAAAELKKTDMAVEVGPGFGVLTLALAERVNKVIAFEIEKKLIPYWAEQIKQFPNIRVEWGNVLRQLGTWNLELGTYKVVANLPYQITSAVIRAFLEADNPPEVMVLMVQKEVAERICAEPGGMSLLSVSVQYYAKPEIIAIVPRSYFWPEPAVDSAIIVLKVHPVKSGKAGPPRICGVELNGVNSRHPTGGHVDKDFFKIVKAGFASRRKLLIKNLESLVGKGRRGELADSFSKLGLESTVRAQELSVEDWRALCQEIHKLHGL